MNLQRPGGELCTALPEWNRFHWNFRVTTRSKANQLFPRLNFSQAKKCPQPWKRPRFRHRATIFDSAGITDCGGGIGSPVGNIAGGSFSASAILSCAEVTLPEAVRGSKNLTECLSFQQTATSSAQPSRPTQFGSAPCSKSHRMVSMWPRCAAKESNEQEESSADHEAGMALP